VKPDLRPRVKRVLAHPLTTRTRTILRRTVIAVSVILAVAFVTTFTVDLGPSLRERAERAASGYMGRPMHIGGLRIHLGRGQFELTDVRIEGLTPEARPFFTARRIYVTLDWLPLASRRVVIPEVTLTDWKMLVEQMPDNGPISFPRINRQGGGNRGGWTVTVPWVRAHRGEFAYYDHGSPWSIVAPNIDITIVRPGNEYLGTAAFSKGTVKIQTWEPFSADMRSTFKIDQGRVLLNLIDLKTDGAHTVLRGDVNMGFWPEQMYRMTSTIDFATMRRIFFAKDNFALSGTGIFTGNFHLFRDLAPGGGSRIGRELKGVLESREAGIEAHRFQDFRSDVRWTPDILDVRNATADFYGGELRFGYRMAPLGRRDRKPTYTFDYELADVDLQTYTDFLELPGLRLAGRLSGPSTLQWPSGAWSERRGSGELRLDPPEGAVVQTRQMPVERLAAREARGVVLGPFSAHTPLEPVPVAGNLSYSFDPAGITMGPSRLATPETHVEFEGRTSWARTETRMPFHVTSSDWQESDRLFAGFLTALGAPTRAIPVEGHGTFDGTVFGDLRRPRIEGTFAGDRMRAFDVTWGSINGAAVIENNYADVKNAVIQSGESSIQADGRFSIGFPRRDGGEEINAVIRIDRRPVVDLRSAFGIEDYDFDGTLSGEFHVFGNYLTPLGFGSMRIVDAVAYGQPFESASAGVRLEGDGVRLDAIEAFGVGGRGTGAAFVGWNGMYSFNFDARGLAVESLPFAANAPLPVSGLIDATATGSGSFTAPQYTVKGTLRDFFVGDEGVGEVFGTLGINNDLMTVSLNAASPRLAASVSGRVALTPEMDAELTFLATDTSLDPYLRLVWPQLSPYASAIASGNVRVVGALRDPEHLLVDATVEQFDARLFDYAIRNAAPIRMALDRNAVRITDMRLVGQETQLAVDGVVTLADEQIDMRAVGDANLGILQAFLPNVASSGRAALSATFTGPMRDPSVQGTMKIQDGRIRHFSLPHGLENIGGAVAFDSRAIRLDELRGRLATGDVQFGGTIGLERYQPGRLAVTMTGTNMRLRFPEGMRSLVDATLALDGTPASSVLSGQVTVRDAEYRQPFSTGGGLFDLAGGSSLPAPPSPTTLPLRYDIRIDAPSALHVRNNLMTLDASASLQLQGTFDRPLLFGRADVERGLVNFEARRWVVTRGTIDFNNPVRIDPFIDVEAETRVRAPGETYRVTIRATGTRDRFSQLTFDSDPVLPQTEVLALVFGDIAPGAGETAELRRYGTVTPLEALARDRAARELTSVVSSEVDRVAQQTFGVDTFQITPSLNDTTQQSSRFVPGARLTIGKRLSERAYLTYSRSLTSTNRDQIILLEYDQSDRFSWILSRNEDGTYAVDFRVRRTF
jgi:hypothetical protein